MQLKTWTMTLLLPVFIAMYSTCSDAKHLGIKVHITPPTSANDLNKEVDVLSAKDNHDGTVSVWIFACGYTLEVNVKRDLIVNNDPAISVETMKAVKAVCNGDKFTGN